MAKKNWNNVIFVAVLVVVLAIFSGVNIAGIRFGSIFGQQGLFASDIFAVSAMTTTHCSIAPTSGSVRGLVESQYNLTTDKILPAGSNLSVSHNIGTEKYLQTGSSAGCNYDSSKRLSCEYYLDGIKYGIIDNAGGGMTSAGNETLRLMSAGKTQYVAVFFGGNSNVSGIKGGEHLYELRCRFTDCESCTIPQPITSMKFWKEDELCGALPQGYLAWEEVYTSTKKNGVFSKSNTDYPVEAFCLSQPIQKILTTGQQVTSTEEYKRAYNGENIQIPVGETWKVHYIVSVNKKLGIDQTNCTAQGGTLDEFGDCQIRGFGSSCSGYLNALKQCISTSVNPCPNGYLMGGYCYDTVAFNRDCGWLGKYIVDTPSCERPVSVCTECRTNETCDALAKLCKSEPQIVCGDDYNSTYNIKATLCEFNPDGYGVTLSINNGMDFSGAGDSVFWDFNSFTWSNSPVFDCPNDGKNWNLKEEKGLRICSRTPNESEFCPEIDRTFDYSNAVCIGLTGLTCVEGYAVETLPDGKEICTKLEEDIPMPSGLPTKLGDNQLSNTGIYKEIFDSWILKAGILLIILGVVVLYVKGKIMKK